MAVSNKFVERLVHSLLRLSITRSLFRYFKTSREIIQLAVMSYIRFLLSLRNVEHLLHERASMPALKVFDVGP